ncbi:hypothetical protein K2173_025991 [Erythroxylum novogranatense]|uniref:Uncharacterized protein n=1 Tax=Erythroxylum novogranatense TaxID=1862640 RepID=A0AAV8SIL0_9ROSI|nr:hypothetical protein K2173_025991 [Erythroxylum novogranatense]
MTMSKDGLGIGQIMVLPALILRSTHLFPITLQGTVAMMVTIISSKCPILNLTRRLSEEEERALCSMALSDLRMKPMTIQLIIGSIIQFKGMMTMTDITIEVGGRKSSLCYVPVPPPFVERERSTFVIMIIIKEGNETELNNAANSLTVTQGFGIPG